jgi:hypothetical protein
MRAASDNERQMLGRTSVPVASAGVVTTGLGDVVVDRQGRMLYLFERR